MFCVSLSKYHNLGNVSAPREYHFEVEPSQEVRETGRPATSLFQCISNGVFNMKRAADFILDTTRPGTFNQASYDEFVHSESAGRAAFCFDGLNDFDNPATVRRNIIANRLMGEIRQARDQQNIRNADFSDYPKESL
ncbi:hypothetical protein ANCCAN_09048 [Ancylostoma caninum]|uniref:Uncharacterized protein n=1 Tax=Ancylostoma caninum TaxID=29170 RepID=A0A368GKS2_ANCCA|nr:hypothetical protein ANCCAN_09048 [Ancylostoma caninum]